MAEGSCSNDIDSNLKVQVRQNKQTNNQKKKNQKKRKM